MPREICILYEAFPTLPEKDTQIKEYQNAPSYKYQQHLPYQWPFKA